VRRALEQGMNIVDTAEGYNTEEIVGRAVSQAPRDSVILSTKKHVAQKSSFPSGAWEPRMNVSSRTTR
jgi:aryl-alcohol dehydrogenase-like predicted oxidoreductase